MCVCAGVCHWGICLGLHLSMATDETPMLSISQLTVTSLSGNEWWYIGMISHERFESCHIYNTLEGLAARSLTASVFGRQALKLRLWNIFFASVLSRSLHSMFQIKCISHCLSLSLSNYLCLSELDSSRDGVDNREALWHYGEVSWGFCVACQWGGASEPWIGSLSRR